MMEQTSISHFFTLRVWSEVDQDDIIHWRGKLRHIPSDTTYYFRDWAALIPLLLSVLRQYPPDDQNTTINQELDQ